MTSKAATLVVSLLLGPALDQGIEAQERVVRKREIRVEEGLLSVSLDRALAGQVFQTIAQRGKILIQLDETLLKVPLTEEFEQVPLEEGLRRLIGQFQIQNFAMGYVAEPAGGRRLASVEILAPGGQGAVREFGKRAAPGVPQEGDELSKGQLIQRDRGLKPGAQKHFEKTGELPTRVPVGIELRKERGDRMPGNWSWKYDQYRENKEAMKAKESGSEEKK